MCTSPPAAGACRPANLTEVPLDTPETTLLQRIDVDPEALPLSRPLMVWVIALASSEVRWNGHLVGRNGIPAPNRAQEQPGRFVATFVVPNELVKRGQNTLSVRLSAHHLWLPVMRPVHDLRVSYYETPSLPGLSVYLPALLMLGALIAACLYFGSTAFLDRTDRGALLLALASASTLAQLLVETMRVFVAYDYPWHLPRLLALAIFSTASATFAAGYAARRFAPAWQTRTMLATSAAGTLGILSIPAWDFKALAALLAGLVAVLISAVKGVTTRMPGARIAVALTALTIALLVYELNVFLDQTYFLAAAALFLLLVAEQVLVLRSARRAREAAAMRAADLEQSLERARRPAEPLVVLKDGARAHRLSPQEIKFIKAADDYSEVHLNDGRTLLITMPLSRTHATLPQEFVRLHKSYVVNGNHVTQVSTRPQGGRSVVLTGGQSLPVGRTYAEALTRWMAPVGKG